MEVGAADVGGRDADEHVGGAFDPGVGYVFDRHLAGAFVDECLHRVIT
ncbi:putative Zn-containing alcohol dehdyrogenase [Streptomyces sp. Tu6071]|nr:putative Zn-containing alcohol dehdyrogenase [Streptomyces sp. Tu6071]